MTAVPCNGCRACCIGQRILLDDDETGFISVPTARGDGPIVRMLAHKAHSPECIYLTTIGCSIHDKAPRACRSFDCRVWLKRFDPSWWAIMEGDGLDGAVVKAARDRLE